MLARVLVCLFRWINSRPGRIAGPGVPAAGGVCEGRAHPKVCHPGPVRGGPEITN